MNFIKRVVAGPGDEIYIQNGHVYRKAKGTTTFVREKDSYIKECGANPECTFSKPIKIPAGHWFMMGDNRGDRTTAGSGDRFQPPGSSARPSSPTGPSTGSAPSETKWGAARWESPAAAAGRGLSTLRAEAGGAARGRKLFAFDRALGSRLIAGADEAGRGSLAGPLVAARCCSTTSGSAPARCGCWAR